MQPVTTPVDWRRKAAEATPLSWTAGVVAAADLRSAPAGLAALDTGDEATARAAAAACRDAVWGQPADLAGVRAGPDLTVLAHRPGQQHGVLGAAVGFLARAFETFGDARDLDAAAELHDLTVALGAEVWDEPGGWTVGWGAALLYAVTGEQAFLATAERAADAMCETADLDDRSRSLLAEMADAAEARAGLDAGDDEEADHEPAPG